MALDLCILLLLTFVYFYVVSRPRPSFLRSPSAGPSSTNNNNTSAAPSSPVITTAASPSGSRKPSISSPLASPALSLPLSSRKSQTTPLSLASPTNSYRSSLPPATLHLTDPEVQSALASPAFTADSVDSVDTAASSPLVIVGGGSSSSTRNNLSAASASALSSVKQGLNVLGRKRSPVFPKTKSAKSTVSTVQSQNQSGHLSQLPPSLLSPVSSAPAPASALDTPIMTTTPTTTTTIRSVPSSEGVASDSSSDAPSTTTTATARNSAFSSSVNSTASMASSHDDKSSCPPHSASRAPGSASPLPQSLSSPQIPSPSRNTSATLSDAPFSLNSATDPSSSYPTSLQDSPGAATITNGASISSTPSTVPQPDSLSFASTGLAPFPHNQHPTLSLLASSDRSGASNTIDDTNLLSADSIDSKFPPVAPPLPSPEQSLEMASAEAAENGGVVANNSNFSNQANDPSWDSTIGKAGLGKTGRVINKLVSDNEALKRDIQIERLRAEESKQAAKMIEEKMDRIVSDYESRLLEANVTKTLLSRKERQVESLTASLDMEKARAKEALGREKTWQDEADKLRQSSQAQIDEANNMAQLMEGRYNAIASHWKDQGEETMRAVGKIQGEIGAIVEERRKDDDKINTLRELCDQQHLNIVMLQRQKDELQAGFAAYKREQESQLRDIKELSKQREEHMEGLLRESKEALDKLRWALNVKENVKGAM